MRRLYTKRSISYLEMWRVVGKRGDRPRGYNEFEQMKTCRKVKKGATVLQQSLLKLQYSNLKNVITVLIMVIYTF